MCFGKCARCIGATLIPLAVLAVAANILLYFPNGETKYAERNQLTSLVWLFEGIIGAGILMILPIVVFISLEHDDCCGCCGNQDCGKSCAMLSSVLVALIGIAGAGYCVIVSALGLAQGPYCLTDSGWEYPFNDTNGRYLTNYTSWSQCTEPKHVVTWNVTLFSVLLGISGVELILCFVQLINGLVRGIFGSCCHCQEDSSCNNVEVDMYEFTG
ncbi:transmembrane 4 L6 family member 1-like isoform X2 [Hypanus sabinus]|uniref:transmembrane 4 L6 family member 1-like isoform X2 n=1 Tax=Hypanus sabinus TaxID=79690 RepID=UPI0028C472C9|nr:transmembrane 4 L6 family member 1-like isoform X2 [Hypanus sabinus]